MVILSLSYYGTYILHESQFRERRKVYLSRFPWSESPHPGLRRQPDWWVVRGPYVVLEGRVDGLSTYGLGTEVRSTTDTREKERTQVEVLTLPPTRDLLHDVKRRRWYISLLVWDLPVFSGKGRLGGWRWSSEVFFVKTGSLFVCLPSLPVRSGPGWSFDWRFGPSDPSTRMSGETTRNFYSVFPFVNGGVSFVDETLKTPTRVSLSRGGHSQGSSSVVVDPEQGYFLPGSRVSTGVGTEGVLLRLR